MLVALAATFDTGKPANSIRNRNAILPLFLSAVLLTLIVLYFTGTTGKPRTVSLSLPFKKGKYFVFQGGKGLPTNVFHSAMRGTIYAMDIVKLNPMGGRAKHIFSKRLEDYEIFGDTVYSPCSGHIVFTRNDRPDNIPPYRAEGRGNLNGVLIETDSFYVYLGHFKQGSVMVKPGDFVTAGQPLALAGNSGFTLEPHLHIQAHQKTYSNIPWYREPPLFIRFNGRSYNLFEVINAQQ
ncbi:MAG: M23 family metallopeptidase [Flavipsychrobacter sp.]